jgi:hypothetical protein
LDAVNHLGLDHLDGHGEPRHLPVPGPTGHIDLSNGATINFTELERVTW